MKPDIQRAIEIAKEEVCDPSNDCVFCREFLDIAITALEQQNKEPCEYCSGKRALYYTKRNNSKTMITIVSDVLWVDFSDDYNKGHIDLNINYCPICGADMRTETEHGLD